MEVHSVVPELLCADRHDKVNRCSFVTYDHDKRYK